MIMLSGCILKLSITKQVLMEITFQRIYDTTHFFYCALIDRSHKIFFTLFLIKPD